jgi:hypothetical protein
LKRELAHGHPPEARLVVSYNEIKNK